ncbi:MAG: hypothetical protein R3F24_06650 [Gammaproteobacteria bacterium]
MNREKKSFIPSSLVAIVAVIALVIVEVLAVGKGWVPLFGKHSTEVYFGAEPESWVASYASGFTDHQIYFVFKADRDWVERAVTFARLDDVGEMQQADCISGPSYPPWWFTLAPRSQGVCWRGRMVHGGIMTMHYSPSSGFVHVFDFSS